MSSIATVTPLDTLNATMYAMSRVLKELCEDPAVQANYKGLQWKDYSKNKIFTCPEGLENCVYGHADITTPELCDSLSQPFYNESGYPIPKEQYTGKAKVPLAFQQDKGQCVLSNYLLKRWCEVPASRGFKVDDKGNVTSTSDESGVTDVPPFRYDKGKSMCYMTKSYCDAMETDFKDGIVPTCEEPKDAEILGYFGLGNTLLKYIKRAFKGDFSCKKVTKIIDDKAIKKKVLISPDFGGKGVNLYLLEWKPVLSTKTPNIGFIYSELKNKPEYFNNLIKGEDGYYYFETTLDEIQRLEEDKSKINYHKRLHQIYTQNDSLILMLKDVINKVKSKKT